MRALRPPFVVASPEGRRIRTRLRLTAHEESAMVALGEHLGRLAGQDLADRTRLGDGSSERARRKRGLTAESSSRWAGAITRLTDDQYRRARANLVGHARGLRRAIARVEGRLAMAVGERRGRTRGYASQVERFQKQRRLQHLQAELFKTERNLQAGHVSIVRGGRRLACLRHNLAEASLTPAQWRERWQAARLFITADGERDKRLGNETIRIDPESGVVEIKLPGALRDHANAAHTRLRLARPVRFSHRAEEWLAQVESGAVRYDIIYDVERDRWYLDASWTINQEPLPSPEEALARGALGVDLNAGHLSAWVLDRAGNPLGRPIRLEVPQDGTAAYHDAQLRHAIKRLLDLAEHHGVKAIAIEDLDFDDARHEGRERLGRGRKGKRRRRQIAGIPTAQLRQRLAQMAANRGIWIVACDPAYTSKWGVQHWQAPLSTRTFKASRHDVASVVIGRRALGHRAVRRAGVTTPRPEDRGWRATAQGRDVRLAWAADRPRGARASPQAVSKTRSGNRCDHEPNFPKTVRGKW